MLPLTFKTLKEPGALTRSPLASRKQLTILPALQVPGFEQSGEADLGPQGLRFPRLDRDLLLLHLLQHWRPATHECCWVRDSGLLFPGGSFHCR